MSENLTQRVEHLLHASLHALLDKAEDLAPEMSLQQSIRQIERAIDEVRGELGKTIAQKHLASKQMADQSSRHETLGDNIATALSLGRDDLAQAGISEQLDIEAHLLSLEHSIADFIQQEKELEGYVFALQNKRQEMLQALKNFQQSKSQTNPQTGYSPLGNIDQRVAQSGHAFERLMARHTGLSITNTNDDNLARLKELHELGKENAIAKRLAQLKTHQQKTHQPNDGGNNT